MMSQMYLHVHYASSAMHLTNGAQLNWATSSFGGLWLGSWTLLSNGGLGSPVLRKEISSNLQFNWEYVDTLDLTTKTNFHHLIQVTHGRLMYAGYSKLKEFPVVLLSPHFVLFILENSVNSFRKWKKITIQGSVVFVTENTPKEQKDRRLLSSFG